MGMSMALKITSFDANGISGTSSSGQPVEFFVGSEHCQTVTPNLSNMEFAFRFENQVGSFVGVDDLSFRQYNSLSTPDVDENVVGFIRRNIDIESALRNYYRSLGDYPEVPQAMLNYIGSGEAGQSGYRLIGFIYFYHLLKLIGIRGNSRIMDIGCGAGRIGFGLAPFLHAEKGEYIGFDTWGDGIQWAHDNLRPLYPLLSFNTLTAPEQGRRKGYMAEYAAEIPVDSNSFDLVISTSLFTHLKQVAYMSYLQQIHRALKLNGVALITAFLVKPHEQNWVRETKANDVDDSGMYVIDDTYADSYLWEDKFLEDIRSSGLTVCRYLPGLWRKRLPGNEVVCSDNFQDMVVVKKVVA
jgi:SAM-dependent methyltransferase